MGITALFKGAWKRLRGLPGPLLVVLGALGLILAVGGGYYGVRTYNYVQHDNDFCLSCHLMKAPYEKFAKSAHRDLGCKACHRPTPVARSKMALTQILKNPSELETHAEVPNETCEECHVKGDPEKWRLIASSVGHRLHFESQDTALKGLKCVQCHSTSLHEFAAVDKTCGQAGCHENTQIKLGKMSKLSLHCAVCHEFNKPVAKTVKGDSLQSSIRPKSQECLSCHAMRERMGKISDIDPHGAVCSTCHNPHEQKTPAEAVARCISCHKNADTLTVMHRGIPTAALNKCVTCHVAHDFVAKGKNCLDCHADIYNTAPPQRGALAPRSGSAASVVMVSLRHPTREPAGATQAGATQARQGRFDHNRHRAVQCASCHETVKSHGTLKITAPRDCQSCHHSGSAVARCETCHQKSEYSAVTYPRTETFKLSVGQKTRTVSFNHNRHDKVACTQCHTDPATRSTAALKCNSCHENHHQPNQNCRSCHEKPPISVHPPAKVHVTCAGSGCHSNVPAPIRSMPRTREICLGCHQDKVRHQPQKNCADCHAMPKPRTAFAAHPSRVAGMPSP